MSRRLIALMSMFAVFSSLFVFGVASAESDPAYLIWKGSDTNQTREYTSVYGSYTIPIGGVQGEYILIGSDEQFHGVELNIVEGAEGGTYQAQYQRFGSGWVDTEAGDLDGMSGTVRLEWDLNEWGDAWDSSYSASNFNFDEVEGVDSGTLNVIDAYWILIETTSSDPDGALITADTITLLGEGDVSFEPAVVVDQQSIDTTNTSFSDTYHGEDATVASEYAKRTGIVEGYDDGTFRPDNSVNRAELMKFLVAGQGIEPTSYTSSCFPDVPAGEWYEKYVCYAYDMGWVDGYPDGTFAPGNTVNRAEASKMIVNALSFGDISEDISYMIYEDVDTSAWYAPYLFQIQKYGIEDTDDLWGYSFGISDGMTRERVATFIFRMLSVQGVGASYYNADVRGEFLESEGLSDLADYAYTSTSSNDDDDDQGYYSVNMSFESFSDCVDPDVTITNYSGYSVDFTDWYLDPFNGDDVYPFSGVVLDDGESETVTVSADFSGEDSSISLKSDEGGIVASDWCN